MFEKNRSKEIWNFPFNILNMHIISMSLSDALIPLDSSIFSAFSYVLPFGNWFIPYFWRSPKEKNRWLHKEGVGKNGGMVTEGLWRIGMNA